MGNNLIQINPAISVEMTTSENYTVRSGSFDYSASGNENPDDREIVSWKTERNSGTRYRFGDLMDLQQSTNLYATWGHFLSVRFNKNDEAVSGEMADMQMDDVDEATLDGNGFISQSKSFTGWSTSSASGIAYHDGDQISYQSYLDNGGEVVDSKMNLYAQWRNENVYSKILENLENFSDDKLTSIPETGQSLIFDGYLPKPGDMFYTKWVQMPSNSQLNTLRLRVLGYNGVIPQYVKYKNGSNTIYVSSVNSSKKLSTISEGAAIYTRSEDNEFATNGQTIDVGGIGSETFTYGQTNSTWGISKIKPYDVPMQITVDGTVYNFAGYNVTLMTTTYISPSGYTKGSFGCGDHTDLTWHTSGIRYWLNGTDNTGVRWTSGSGFHTGIRGMIQRLTDGIQLAMIPVVNRTPDSGGSVYYTTIDKIWLLGRGNIAGGYQDTAKFTWFEYHLPTSVDWFLRTFHSSNTVTYVTTSGGFAGSYAAVCRGIYPVLSLG